MRTFLISYDLGQPAHNRHALSSAIMMLGQSWARPLDQTWYIKADIEGSDIENVLSGLLNDGDGLLVQCVEHDAMMANTQLRWFKQRAQTKKTRIDKNVVTFPTAADIPAFDSDFALAS